MLPYTDTFRNPHIHIPRITKQVKSTTVKDTHQIKYLQDLSRNASMEAIRPSSRDLITVKVSISEKCCLFEKKCLFSNASGLALKPRNLLCNKQLWCLSSPWSREQSTCAADHSSPSCAEVKNVWSYTSLPHTYS